MYCAKFNRGLGKSSADAYSAELITLHIISATAILYIHEQIVCLCDWFYNINHQIALTKTSMPEFKRHT